MSSNEGSWSKVGKTPPSSILQAAARNSPTRTFASVQSTSRTPLNRNQGESKKKANAKNTTGKSNNKNNRNTPSRSDSIKQNGSNQQKTTQSENVVLLQTTGSGDTDVERSIHRLSQDRFLACRMQYLDPPASWTPHERCLWASAERKMLISKEMDTLYTFKPLEVNDATRFKPRVMQNNNVSNQASMEEQLRKATAILNKLSWTTLDRLTGMFLVTLGESVKQNGDTLSPEFVRRSMALIVDKAMEEPHFAELYARFSAKLASVHKTFKKTVLAICQNEFATSDDAGMTLAADLEPGEREFELLKARKRSVGLMQFIGELYKLRLIKGAIMIGCLERLLQHDDEERLGCFAKLMTTIGARLHQHENEPEMQVMWDTVYSMAGRAENGPKAPSTRIKFLLQDLIELKKSGWIQRREEDKAKTIAQIHQEVAAEEAAASKKSVSWRMTRSQSGGMLRQPAPTSKLPIPTDVDGFTQIPSKPKRSVRRAQSDASPALTSLQRAMQSPKPTKGTKMKSELPYSAPRQPRRSNSPTGPASAVETLHATPIVEVPDTKECREKTKSILKDFFVGGDTNDALLSLQDIVNKDQDGYLERGAAVIESAVLLVMEMKEEDVRKMLDVVTYCLGNDRIDVRSLKAGLNDPLECLRDIEIDAPLAAKFLAMIMAEWLSNDFMSLDLLLDGPDYFLSDGRPAELAVQMLALREAEPSQAELETVFKLLTAQDKEEHSSLSDWVRSLKQL